MCINLKHVQQSQDVGVTTKLHDGNLPLKLLLQGRLPHQKLLPHNLNGRQLTRLYMLGELDLPCAAKTQTK